MNRDELLRQALRFSADDRAIIASRLVDSLSEPGDASVDAEWSAEVERRIAAYDRGEAQSMSLDDVAAALRRHKKSA